MKRVFLGAFLAIGILGAATADDSPNTVIEESVRLLAEQLDGRKEELSANRDELYRIIDGILLPRFDRKFAAQVVLAKHWRTASAGRQEIRPALGRSGGPSRRVFGCGSLRGDR